jgi:hypothetical protein
LKGGISLHIQEASLEPFDYPTNRIQKGLRLAYRNVDLSEEGVGFGMPVLKFGHEAIFPGSRHIAFEKNEKMTIIKMDFDLNLVERKMLYERRKTTNLFIRSMNIFADSTGNIPI